MNIALNQITAVISANSHRRFSFVRTAVAACVFGFAMASAAAGQFDRERFAPRQQQEQGQRHGSAERQSEPRQYEQRQYESRPYGSRQYESRQSDQRQYEQQRQSEQRQSEQRQYDQRQVDNQRQYEQRQNNQRAYEEQRRAQEQQGQGADNGRKPRLTPSERADLRRQINEAGQDIYGKPPRR
ncbi:MAG: hypothetical protein V4857_18585 [Pseudomonadota bacterium]